MKVKQNQLKRQIRKAMAENSKLNIKLDLQLFAQQITDSPINVSCGLFIFNLGLFGSVSIQNLSITLDFNYLLVDFLFNLDFINICSLLFYSYSI